jgi:hypothetical protein
MRGGPAVRPDVPLFVVAWVRQQRPRERATSFNRGPHMTKQLESDRSVKNLHRYGRGSQPSAALKNPARLKMEIASVQYAGAAATANGDLPSWRITFLLESEYLLATSFTMLAIGAADVIEARQKSVIILRHFAQNLVDAANAFSP